MEQVTNSGTILMAGDDRVFFYADVSLVATLPGRTSNEYGEEFHVEVNNNNEAFRGVPTRTTPSGRLGYQVFSDKTLLCRKCKFERIRRCSENGTSVIVVHVKTTRHLTQF